MSSSRSLPRELLHLAWPVLIAQAAVMANGVIDTLMAGRLSSVDLAAVGIGATMLLPMDIRIASDNARIGFVFSQRGIVPEAASSWFLPRLVGIAQALEWCYSGRVFPAQEALAGRLVSKVEPIRVIEIIER